MPAGWRTLLECAIRSSTLADDVQRQNWVTNAGWVLLRLTAQDFYRRPEAIIAEVRTQLIQRG
jgi:very-short-patch-repair endonuclease